MTLSATKGVFVGFHEQRKIDIAYQVIHGQLSMDQGATLLQKSYRQTRRIVAKIKSKGILGVKHGNFARVPANKTPDTVKRVVLDLLRNQYYDFNLTHFRERLEQDHQITVPKETLRRWAHAEGLVKRARKSRRRAKTHKTRPRLPQAGMMMQLDGSTHAWLGERGPKSCLIGGIDDATSVCPHAEFFSVEDTLSVLSTLKRIVERVGVPEVLYVDQAQHFGKHYNRRLYIDWEKHLTHVERAMEELGCRVLFAQSPQAKGRIERMWNTFQDRLIPELRLQGVSDMSSANAYLHEKFIPEFNKKFSVAPSDEKIAFKPIPATWQNRLDWVFCIREYRKVGAGETISWKGKTYLVNNNYGLALKNTTIEIRTRLDGVHQAFYAGRIVNLLDIGSTEFLNKKCA
jgi:transposase